MNNNQDYTDREEIESRITQILNKESYTNQLNSIDPSIRKTLEDVLVLNKEFSIREKWFSEAQRIAKIGSWEFYPRSITIKLSDEIFSIFGMNPGDPVPDFEAYLAKIHEDDREGVKQAMIAAAEKGKPYTMEIRLVMPDKSIRWVLSICSPILDENNEVIKLHGIAYDIDERKKGELALGASERFFKALIDNSSDYVQTVNTKGKILFQSPTFKRLTGYSIEERVGRSVIELVHPDDKSRAANFLSQIATGEENPKSMEMRLIRKDGKVIWIESTLSNLLDEPAVGGIVVNTREITDRKLAEEKLIQQNEELKKINTELDSFVYRASHDLRAPLVSLLGLINVAKEEKEEVTRQQYFGLMQRSVDKLDLFIKNIIDYSRNSRLEVSIHPVNFKELIYEILDDLKYMDGNRDITKQIQINDNSNFYTDIFRLKVILNNIISNAIRYRNPRTDSYLQVNIQASSKKAILEITDNGIGIEKEYVDKIFNMFFRASETNVGSGLGLYIVKQAIIILKGKVEVESTIGKGTTFKIEIPNGRE